MLHVFSKGSEVAFNEAFGKSQADTPGAQRLLFMVHYLAVHNKQSFYLFCRDKKNLNHNEIHIPALGEKGRWWAMYQAAGDIDRSFQLYYDYFIFKANDTTESKIYRGLFRSSKKSPPDSPPEAINGRVGSITQRGQRRELQSAEEGVKMAKKCGREFAGNLHHHGIAWRSGCIDAFIGSIIIHKDGFVKLGGC